MYFLATPSGMQELSYLTRNRTHALCTEVWSLNHWTTRDVPYIANSDWNIKRHKVCCFCPHAVFIPSGSGDRGFRSTAHRCHRLPLRLPALGRIPDHWPRPWRWFYILLPDFTWPPLRYPGLSSMMLWKRKCLALDCVRRWIQNQTPVWISSQAVNSRLLSGTRALRRNTLNLMETGIKAKADERTESKEV